MDEYKNFNKALKVFIRSTIECFPELIEFKIQPTISFNLLELFEINIDNKNKWGLNVVENPINSTSTNCFGEYIGKHFK